ncbi:ThuA domain-containing protein [Chitinophagaceae bacterium LB-8]|uniref:ThuA domain-containing protein n=1 Tax=Paraflavisolibacter caeni TaxID=2982496 RepID=A0A9X2Y1F6_9BACT|nr:ThuA domain-containing protein [Paraflavisolibacter caeni]MCU7552822.1 ThuA domain-containing protein [Paraflavisolibacter caeni]
MNRLFACLQSIALIVVLFFVLTSCSKRSGTPRVLVFSKTAGYHHESIPDGIAAIKKLGSQNNFLVDTTTNADWFMEDTLDKYAAVIFLSTTGDVLNHYQEAEFERYIQAGGGFVGIHAAADAEYDWGWYGRLVGGYFLDHPGIHDTFPNVQEGIFQVVDQDNNASRHLPKQWKRIDEFYSFKKLNKDVHILLTINENSYHGGHKMGEHPMTWYHEYDGGRAFYTASGHTKESFSEPDFLRLLLGGIQYAIGDNKKLDYRKTKTAQVPEEERFAKTSLVSGQLFEPTEMTILPNLDVLIAQRRGEILLYKKGDSILKQAGFLNVYYKTSTPGVNAEEGLLGIKADPDFDKNHYVFVFYSPADTSVNRLSRFRFENDKIDPSSEKVVLQFYSQREICCHTGGSIAFDKDGLLYLSTGDNSTPFDEPKQPYPNSGYAPLDQRLGHEQYDARRTAGNPNDLRGKIIRIRVKEDGSYEIPDGNLYPKGQKGTRPEIYVQGNRNPYRISVDQKNGFLYWGEVGPDAGRDSFGIRGPRGYDEINQARKAGFFGWPLFVGNNYAYREFDYNTGTAGKIFDPAKPVNTSRNNTGKQNLPPAQPAFIWYPYDPSPDFPQVGAGGRNAMAGPVYYTDLFPKETRLPGYYNNKLFIYDWIRGWIKAVTLQANGDFDKMEPFMENTKLNSCIDMEVGPDGKLYLLEYGSGWFSKNPDAGLSRIDYNGGNLAPRIASFQVDKTSGLLPLRVVATVKAKDPEKDGLQYTWNLGGMSKETSEPRLEHTFDKAGEYTLYVTVRDKKGASVKSEQINVIAGNEAPMVNISLQGNKTFYFPGRPVAYSVTYKDKEDGMMTADSSALFISADYVEGSDKAGASLGHQVLSEAMMGKTLLEAQDCKACHKVEVKSVGPSFSAVSERYQKESGAEKLLVNKIIKGGAGVWGETAMPAHPNLKEGDVRQIVTYILSLKGNSAQKKSLPVKGLVPSTLGKPAKENGVLLLTASYTDKGSNGVRPLTTEASIALRSNIVTFGSVKAMKEYNTISINGTQLMIVPKSEGWFRLDSLDMTGITSAELSLAWQKAPEKGYIFEFHLDAPNGQKIGSTELNGGMPIGKDGKGGTLIKAMLQSVVDGKLHNLLIVSRPKDPKEVNQAGIELVKFNSDSK